MRKFGGIVSGAIKKALSPTIILGWAAASIVVAIAGPFGTFESRTLSWRLPYWAAIIGVSIPLGVMCRVFWESVLRGHFSDWVEDLAAVATMAFIFGPLVVAFNIYLFGPAAEGSIEWPLATLIAFCIGIGLVTTRRWMQDPAASSAQPKERDRLLDRIDAPQGRSIARVSSDNHHIRIWTDDGTEYRVLMRLRDAAAEINVEPGLFVHRSHWVAFAHINGVGQIEGKEQVELTCGTRLPVGATFRDGLISAGISFS